MQHFSSTIPWFAPGVAVSLVVGLLLAQPVADFYRSGRANSFLLVVSVGVIASATLTPDSAALAYSGSSSSTCDLTRTWLAPLTEYLRLNESSLNVALFVPLGLALGLLPRSQRRTGAVVMAFGLTFAIEAIQLAVSVLGRGCQGADLVDNTLGLIFGLVCGLLFARAKRGAQARLA